MIIQKEYKFYAAHRNEELHDKCRNLHGHRYGVVCHFEVERQGSISTLFQTFDEQVEPWLKNHYDHALLIHENDSLFETFRQHQQRTGEQMKLKVFPFPTSVENLAFMLFGEIMDLGFRLKLLEVRETDTSVIRYSFENWIQDQRQMKLSTGLLGSDHAGDQVHPVVDSSTTKPCDVSRNGV